LATAAKVSIMQVCDETPIGLIVRVQSGDETAWADFAARCSDILKLWCVRWGLQQADADDIGQDTLLLILANIHEFRRRGTGSFRSWVRTIAWRCWCDAIAKTERSLSPERINLFQRPAEARQSLEEHFDQLFLHQLLEQAMATVRCRVQEATWEAFRLTALEGLRAETVAAITGLQVSAVYSARCRVQRLITGEFRRLSNNCPEID
jgi:RNA polymerase sigma-70 factor (ECF subfamily)